MDRFVAFEGCFNFRDLGGYETADGRTVRWGRLFRADSVHLMTSSDTLVARDQLGLVTLLDLRSDLEVRVGGEGELAADGLARLHVPITDVVAGAPVRGVDSVVGEVARDADRSPATMSARYWGMLCASGPLIVSAVRALAREESLPSVFFCAAGKDRTGVLAAVMLGALDVADEQIVADYVLTEKAIGSIIRRLGASSNAPAMYRDNPPEHFRPYAKTMWTLLERVRERYATMSGYLLESGLDEASLVRLRANLLEEGR